MATLRSALAMRESCQDAGIVLELLVCADPDDRACGALLGEAAPYESLTPRQGRYRSPGVIPSEWVDQARGEYIALLEAPDLLSRDWILRALESLRSLAPRQRTRAVIHPEATFFPELALTYLTPRPAQGPWSEAPASAFAANPFGAAFLTHRSLLEARPMPEPEFDGDCPSWAWQCDLLSEDVVHTSAPGTFHFVRTRERSLRTGCGGICDLSVPGPARPFTRLLADESPQEDRSSRPSRLLALASQELRSFAPDLHGPLEETGAWNPLVPAAGCLDSAKAYSQAMQALGPSPDLVFVQHFLARGGSEKETLLSLGAIREARADLRLAVILTEERESPWKARVPAGVPVVELGILSCRLKPHERRLLLLRILRQAAPRGINNVISPLCWEVYARYAGALARSSKLLVTEFCVNRSDRGNPETFAYSHLPECWEHVDLLLADNRHLLEHLSQAFGFDRTEVLRYPPDTAFRAPALRARPGGRLRVLWAGRFVRQKRLDVLYEVASRCPELEFHVYGEGWRETGVQELRERLDSLPNVVSHGAFDCFEGLPAASHDVLLYTSEWDGMPNILLEAMAAGLPVVVPAVGGIPELVDSSTGYIVSGAEAIGEYIGCLRSIAADPIDALARARRAQTRLARRHSSENLRESWTRTLKNCLGSPYRPRSRTICLPSNRLASPLGCQSYLET
ncbi:MAG TPA: glycosyltransferase family 4 protein [Bdellovibrionota bacterium]|nr:glycosyltransferase family 4 protein [Bdellovibrionota bacterium]